MKKGKMTDKQRATISEYLKKGSKSFLNMTESVSRVYPVKNRETAASMGSRLLRNDNFRSELERIAEHLGIGIQFRLSIAGEIARGAIRTKTVERRYKPDPAHPGKLILSGRTERERDPTPADRLRAIRAIDKTTGHDDLVKHNAELARQQIEDIYTSMVTEDVESEIMEAIQDSGTTMVGQSPDSHLGTDADRSRDITAIAADSSGHGSESLVHGSGVPGSVHAGERTQSAAHDGTDPAPASRELEHARVDAPAHTLEPVPASAPDPPLPGDRPPRGLLYGPPLGALKKNEIAENSAEKKIEKSEFDRMVDEGLE